jgi:uncharacterized protein
MRILISGATGLLGGHLVPFLEKKGHEVVRLLRKHERTTLEKGQTFIAWDPSSDHIDLSSLERFDGVIHLAGKSIVEKRWSKQIKRELFQSRCRDTWLLCQALSRVQAKPKVLITASAVGYYGDRGEEELDESASPGKDFLADLCVHWERATDALEHNGTRVLHARFGVILSEKGGMLGKAAAPFRMGLGAVLGTGQQWMSWIGVDDAVRALQFLLRDSQLKGAINVCSSEPVRNREFAELLAKAFHRRVFLRLPAPLLRLFLGEAADALLLASTKAIPARLLNSGFELLQPNLQQLFQAFAWN